MERLMFLFALAVLGAGCSTSGRARGGGGIRDTLDYVAFGISDYYYIHGHMPADYNAIRHAVAPLVKRRSYGVDLTFSWTVLRPSGYDPRHPVNADVRVVGYDAASGKQLVQCEYDLTLASRGSAWFVQESCVGADDFAVRDDPVNIACALAESLVERHEQTGRWVRLRELSVGLEQIRTYASYKCFSYEVRRVKGAERLVFSSTQTNELYIFDPKGLAMAKAPEIVPKKP